MNEVLQVENLSVDYSGRAGTVHALQNISLSIAEGEVLGVVGESGSGKTTLALAVSRLLDDHSAMYKAEAINFLGNDMLRGGASDVDRLRGTQIFMIFQDPFLSLNPLMRIQNQIIEAVKVRYKRSTKTFNKHDAENEVIENLKAVRIGDAEEVAKRYPHQLSGGQNQRVMLAMALTERPRLLIADEPTTALDVTTQAQVLNLLKEIVEKTQMSVMFITHDLAVAGSLCDRILVLYGGMAMEVGPTQKVLNEPHHPYTIGLIKSIPSKTKAEGPLDAIRGSYDSSELERICAFTPRCPFVRDACRRGVPALIQLGDRSVRCVNFGEEYE